MIDTTSKYNLAIRSLQLQMLCRCRNDAAQWRENIEHMFQKFNNLDSLLLLIKLKPYDLTSSVLGFQREENEFQALITPTVRAPSKLSPESLMVIVSSPLGSDAAKEQERAKAIKEAILQ